MKKLWKVTLGTFGSLIFIFCITLIFPNLSYENFGKVFGSLILPVVIGLSIAGYFIKKSKK